VDVTATSAAAVKRKIEQIARSLDPAVLDVRVNDADLLRVESELQALQDLVNEAVMGLQLDGADAAQVKAEISAIATEAREVLVGLNLPERERAEAERALNDWENANEPRNITIIPELLNGSGAAVSARLSWLTREREAPIAPIVDRTAYSKTKAALDTLAALAGARLAWTWIDNLGNALKNLDKAIPAISGVALAVAFLVGWLAAATANLASLSADLSRIAAVALTLPGILTGIVIGLGATVAVMADFNRVLPEVGDALRALQDSMSAIFWERATAPFREFFAVLFPQFQAGLEATSAALGGFFATFATALTSSLDGSLPLMFADLNAAILIATGATGAWAETIRILGEVGAGYLPRMAQWVTDISTRFAEWLAGAEADGRLTAWVDRGLASLHSLGQVITGLYGIFDGLSNAAEQAGSSSLASLAARLHEIADVVNSPEFQGPLIGFLEASHQMMSNIAAGSGEQVKALFASLGATASATFPLIGQAIGGIVGGLAEVLASPAVQGGLEAFFIGVANGAFWLMQATDALGPGVGAVFALLGTAATEAGRILGPVLSTVGEAAAILAPSLGALVSVLAEGFLSVWQLVSPLILLAADAFSTLLAALPIEEFTAFAVSAVTPLVAIISTLLTGAIMPLAVEYLPQLMGAWLAVASAVLPLFDILGKLASEVIVPLVNEFLPPFLELFIQFLNECVVPLVSAILSLVELLLPILIPALEIVGAILLGVVLEAFTAVINIVGGVLQVAAGLIQFIVGVFTGDWQMAWDGIKLVFEGIWNLIVGILQLAWILLTDVILGGITKGLKFIGEFASKGKGYISEFASKIGGWISDLFWKLVAWAGGWAIKMVNKFLELRTKAVLKIEELRAQAVQKWESLKSRVTELAQAIWPAIKAKLTDLKNRTSEQFQELVTSAVNKVKELPQKAKDGLGDLSAKLKQAGKDLIEGFIAGIASSFESVKDTLGNLTDQLGDWKGPAERDKILLYQAGRLVIGGFLIGLESQYASVRASLRAFSNEIGAMQFATPTGDVSVRASAAFDTAISDGADDNAAASRVLNYYAAPNQSLSEDEALFTATNRALRLGW
jgi:phage-related protein